MASRKHTDAMDYMDNMEVEVELAGGAASGSGQTFLLSLANPAFFQEISDSIDDAIIQRLMEMGYTEEEAQYGAKMAFETSSD